MGWTQELLPQQPPGRGYLGQSGLARRPLNTYGFMTAYLDVDGAPVAATIDPVNYQEYTTFQIHAAVKLSAGTHRIYFMLFTGGGFLAAT